MNHFSRRQLLMAASALPFANPALAQSDKATVRILVGFSPGGGTDLVARLIADKLRVVLGQPVIVENMPGVGGRLAANALVAAPSDGNTLMFANNAVHTFQTLVFGEQIKWHYRRDFTPVAGLTSYPLGMAVPASLGVKSVADFVKWAKANPGKVTFGTTGMGGQTHFTGVQFAKAAGIDMPAVPYRGATPLMTDLVGGQVPAGIALMDDMLKFHQSGRVRVIGIFSAKRSPLVPDIPTFAEQGFNNLASDAWQGVWAPPKTPAVLVERLQNAIKKVLEMSEVQQAMMTRLFVVPTYRSARDMARLQDDEIRHWEPIIKASGFKPE